MGSGNQMMIEKEEINRKIWRYTTSVKRYTSSLSTRIRCGRVWKITVIGKYEWRQLRGGIRHYLTDIKKIEVAEKDLAWFEENNAAYRRMKEENGW